MIEGSTDTDCTYGMRGVMTVITTPDIFNFSIFTPDFLVKMEIVPPDWALRQFIHGPLGADIQYHNGTRWTLKNQRLDISESISTFEQRYISHDLAQRYLTVFADGSYDQLGLNCAFSLAKRDPLRFLTKKFSPWLEEVPGDKEVRILPDFHTTVGGGNCLIKCTAGDDLSSENPERCIVLDCNINFPGPLPVEDMLGHISDWKQKEVDLVSTLNMIMEEGSR